eukprot:353666-Amphidinium_carterae.1
MLPTYGQQPSPPAADATSSAADAASSAEGQQTPPVNYIKWCLVNVIINQQVLDSMDDGAASDTFMAAHGWEPSKYNRRYVDFNIEIIYDPSSKKEKINVEHFMQVKSIWGSIMETPFGSSIDNWLSSHLVDYSIVSSSVYQYINSILKLGDHTSIRQKLKYFLHNIFPAGIEELLITSDGQWISYKNININLQTQHTWPASLQHHRHHQEVSQMWKRVRRRRSSHQ